ncbi:MAG: 6-phosphogluconolactonase [Planctomycetia bacterium]|nr:6-phosphogluconolactonase [Planctomycetia bacterium]
MLIKQGQVDALPWRVYDTRDAMGAAAAAYTEGLLLAMQEVQAEIRMIFAAAPSQNEMLAHLAASREIDWGRITAFHMDEYVGLAPDAPQGFGNFLRDRLFSKVPFRQVHYLKDPVAYAKLLQEAPVDICCLGIGENGHIAFNDPGVADFHDPETVKVVALDDVCRQQQVNDGCFATLSDVPTHAMTLTIPTLRACHFLVCTVPSATKRDAVRRLLYEAEISEKLPASTLRRHANAILFLEKNSYPEG